MASPSNMSPWPGVTEPLSLPATDPAVSHAGNLSDSELILTRLREQIAGGTQDPDVLLGAIAISAQAMTDCTGAALGMRRDGNVACVGRSGETAPALGARLSESSGISGECLRSGRSQRCDDTETDSRVDAEVCRHLGLRSIAAVPIRSRLETVGILEVFSTSPYSFNDEHLARLSSLAELADIACSTTFADIQPVETTEQNNPVAISRPEFPVLSSQWAEPQTARKAVWRYFAIAGAVVVLGLFSVASWRMWKELSSRSQSKPLAVQAAESVSAQNQTSLNGNFPLKPTPEQIASTRPASQNAQQGKVVRAAKFESEPDDGLIRSIPSAPSSPENTADRTTIHGPAENDAAANAPPQVAMVTTPDDSLHGILTSHTTLPQLSLPISEGVTPLTLEHKVMPPYPQQARAIRREGAVKLRAVVGDDGRVSQVKLLDGDPILGKAAMDAVRQWRYHPALLNGKPTQTETDITLNFKLP